MADLLSLPSLRKQHLVSEFAGLKQACPEGLFVTLTPGDPALWSAVLFVRDGPYAPAVLRFQIYFPDTYPKLPPLVLFSTDIFHPLVSPLTTYMYSTDGQDDGTVSAADQQPSAPGSFSLRHGFPEWFGRGKPSDAESRPVSGDRRVASAGSDRTTANLGSSAMPPKSSDADTTFGNNSKTGQPNVSIYCILKYIQSAFETAEVLDSVPLEAAGNPGAWHAWRTHRRKSGKLSDRQPSSSQSAQFDEVNVSLASKDGGDGSVSSATTPTVRTPAEWNWDGVWEDRVKKGVSNSLSESVLYGTTGIPDDMIRFLPMGEPDVESIKEKLRCAVGDTDYHR
ncbi:hypothetical protein E4U43_005987 [Claviceps pusilla]|uniref:UBC core domain-containing protein n=1 Tax=Claviceps pusilla TaxID=123648 RepID=A0A9P7NGJ9_9HYPO|nr:hypothetical protein E4U43_005987 [Claviceps pusilla]